MVARRKKTVSSGRGADLAKARSVVLRLEKEVAEVETLIERLEQMFSVLTDQEQALLDRDRAEAAKASAAAREDPNPMTVQAVDIPGLLAAASQKTGLGQKVKGVRTAPSPDGGLMVIGYAISDRKRVPLRGYEIWKEGERFFFWSLRLLIDRMNPAQVYVSHYTGPRPPDEHMVVAWEKASDAESRKLRAEREAQRQKRNAQIRAKKKRRIAQDKARLEAELEAARKLLDKLDRQLKLAKKKLAALESKKPAPKKPAPKKTAKKPAPKKPAKKTKSRKLTAAQKLARKRSRAAKKGWETRLKNKAKKSKARAKKRSRR